MNESVLMEEFIESEINMLTELRMGNGLDRSEYEKCIQTFKDLNSLWKREDSIPEEAVLTIMEIYAELYLFAGNYKDEEKEIIIEAAEHFKMVREQFLSNEVLQEHDHDSIIRNLVKAIGENNGFFVQLEQGKGMNEEQFDNIFLELVHV